MLCGCVLASVLCFKSHDLTVSSSFLFIHREPGEQSAHEHAQRQRPPHATSQNRAIRGAAQRRGGGRHGHRAAMMSSARDRGIEGA